MSEMTPEEIKAHTGRIGEAVTTLGTKWRGFVDGSGKFVTVQCNGEVWHFPQLDHLVSFTPWEDR